VSARHARYDALRALAAEAGAERAATAHTADDQAETVLLRLVRGAGIRGLRGMPARGTVRGLRVVRPFLDVTRDQILDYLKRHGIEYRVDSSNASLGPARNFIRHQVLPLLRERLNPATREAILRAAETFREVDGYLHAEGERILPEVLRRDEDGKLSLDASRMLLYPKLLNTYLFRLALLELNGTIRDLTAAHIETLLSLVSTARRRSADLPGGIRAERERGRVVFTRRIREPARRKEPSKS
jgi:tRNA(Ile)-lysidine synthase